MTAEALVKRLVALVPPARLHLSSGHGVYAANAALRSVVLRQEPVPAQRQSEMDRRSVDRRLDHLGCVGESQSHNCRRDCG